jgi:hypothetical protein
MYQVLSHGNGYFLEVLRKQVYETERDAMDGRRAETRRRFSAGGAGKITRTTCRRA